MPRFETIYEFVDADSKENDSLSGESSKKPKKYDLEVTDPRECTKQTGDQVEKLKSFKCSICMKKFRK